MTAHIQMGEFTNLIQAEVSFLLRNKKNIINILILGILILGLYLGVNLARREQIFKSRAAQDPITFTTNAELRDGKWVALKPKVTLELTSPLGPAVQVTESSIQTVQSKDSPSGFLSKGPVKEAYAAGNCTASLTAACGGADCKGNTLTASWNIDTPTNPDPNARCHIRVWGGTAGTVGYIDKDITVDCGSHSMSINEPLGCFTDDGTYEIQASNDSEGCAPNPQVWSKSFPNCHPKTSPTVRPTASPKSSPVASPTASPAVSPTASPVASPTASPAGAVTTRYRIVEDKADLKDAEWVKYDTDVITIEHDFKTPGQKFIFVQFEGKDAAGKVVTTSEKSCPKCQAEIKVLGPSPVITGCSLSFEGNNTVLNLTADKEKGFGSDKGKVKSGDKELNNIKKWKNDNVQVIWSDAPTGEKIPVVLTNIDGQASEEVQCSASSQLSLGAKVFCRAPSSHDTDNVDLVLVEAFEGGKKTKQKVRIDKDGVVQGLSQKLEAGKKYKISLKAPKSLRKTAALFTAESGTTNIANFNLPVGDIFPVDGGDGAINASDKAELNRQWIIAGSGSGRTGDFNSDGRVNSIDWACMRHDHGSSDDAEPAPGGPPAASPAPNATVSPNPSPTAGASASPSFFRVFVTSSTFNGNLGGLSGGDAKCQERANSANLGGIWKAWLSDSNTSVASRLYHSTNPYKLLNGKVVVDNWTDLTDTGSGSNLKNSININESGGSISRESGENVWTGSGPDGLSNSRPDCNNWADSTTGVSGAVGNSGEANRVNWTYNLGAFDCSSNARLYCFEQPVNTGQ